MGARCGHSSGILAAVIAAERAPAAQPIATDGRFELIPVRFVDLDPEDLAAVSEALAVLGLAANGHGDELVIGVLEESAQATGQPAMALVAGAARAHGLLDLAPDADTELLAERLQTGRVLLAPAEQSAYERLTERVLGMFHTGDPLARYLYRGH
jgi:hypothetical protein